MASTPPVDQIITPPTFNGSGTVGTSGVTTSGGVITAGTFSGPWYIEEQTAEIIYHRVPVYVEVSTTTLKLDSVAATFRVGGTRVACEINASYDSYIDYNTYNTPSWNQAQKFTFLSFSADPNGETYGSLDASTLGPMGSIMTTQPYYNRTPWVGAVSGQVAGVSKTVHGGNFYAVERAGTNMSGTVNPINNGHTDFKKYYPPERAGSFLEDADTKMIINGPSYYIGGVYNTNTESVWKIFQLIDQLGTAISNENLYNIDPPPTVLVTSYGMTEIQRVAGFPEYSILRHDYS